MKPFATVDMEKVQESDMKRGVILMSDKIEVKVNAILSKYVQLEHLIFSMCSGASNIKK